MTSTAHLRRIIYFQFLSAYPKVTCQAKKKPHFLEEVIYLRWERSEGVALDLPMSPIKAWELSY